MTNGTAVVEHKRVSIDFVLSDDPLDNARRAAVLERSNNYMALNSADAIITAIKRGLTPGHYKAEKREDGWYFTLQLQPSYPSH